MARADYRIAYNNAKTDRERRMILQKEVNAASNTGTAVPSFDDFNGVPLPRVFGAGTPTGNRPAFYSLYNYIKAGFKFTGEGINESAYANKNFSVVFADWADRFGMPLNW